MQGIIIFMKELNPENWIGILNIVVLTATAIIVWIYTKATKDANEIRLRPVLNLYLREKAGGKCFKLRNVGETTAYNINFSWPDFDGYSYMFEFRQPNIILESHGDEKKIYLLARKMPNGGIQHTSLENLISILTPESLSGSEIQQVKNEFLTFLVNYENIKQQKFYSIFKFYNKTPLAEDFVIEFLESNEGECSYTKAKEICSFKTKLGD